MKHAPGARRGLKSARERRSEVAHAIREQLDCAPEACLSLAALKPGAAAPPQVEVEARLQKLKGDRERLGGVNLRAEEEEAELSAQLEEMEREKADVEQAIAQAPPGHLQSEPRGPQAPARSLRHRERAFPAPVQDLVRRRHAPSSSWSSPTIRSKSGLEILACPPGKRPQVLTLLSGGEKALTALALDLRRVPHQPVADLRARRGRRAARRRQCRALLPADGGDGAATDTRFLIITHHPLTMSRMSRLFGVTMAESGREPARLGGSWKPRSACATQASSENANSARIP